VRERSEKNFSKEGVGRPSAREDRLGKKGEKGRPAKEEEGGKQIQRNNKKENNK